MRETSGLCSRKHSTASRPLDGCATISIPVGNRSSRQSLTHARMVIYTENAYSIVHNRSLRTPPQLTSERPPPSQEIESTQSRGFCVCQRCGNG